MNFIITYRGFPLQIVNNHCGTVYSITEPNFATAYKTADEAQRVIDSIETRPNDAPLIIKPLSQVKLDRAAKIMSAEYAQ